MCCDGAGWFSDFLEQKSERRTNQADEDTETEEAETVEADAGETDEVEEPEQLAEPVAVTTEDTAADAESARLMRARWSCLYARRIGMIFPTASRVSARRRSPDAPAPGERTILVCMLTLFPRARSRADASCAY